MSIITVSKKLGNWGFAALFLAAFLLAGCKSNSSRFTPLSDSGPSVAVSEPPSLAPVNTPPATTPPAKTPPLNTPPANNPPAQPPTATGRTNNSSPDTINVGEAIEIAFMDMVTPVEPIRERVKEDGNITLLYNQTFHIANKKRADIEKEIHDFYVPNYVKKMTVSVRHQEGMSYFYVNGEVKMPDRKFYSGHITVLNAIASCGGFTEWADRKRVSLTRGDGRKEKDINANKVKANSPEDLEVFPGDSITVPRWTLGL